jgi:hypothetical protein
MTQQNLIENCTHISVFKVTSCLVEEFFYFYIYAHKKTAPAFPQGRFFLLIKASWTPVDDVFN